MAYNLWSVKWDNATKLMYCVARDAKELMEQNVRILAFATCKRFKIFKQKLQSNEIKQHSTPFGNINPNMQPFRVFFVW